MEKELKGTGSIKLSGDDIRVLSILFGCKSALIRLCDLTGFSKDKIESILNNLIHIGIVCCDEENTDLYGISNRWVEEMREYCYLDDVGCNKFDPEGFRNAKEYNNRKLNGIQYRDPDSVSYKLYSDLATLYCNRKLPNGKLIKLKGITKVELLKQKLFYYGLECEIEDECIITFGSDYIGPSTTSAYNRRIDDRKVGSILKDGRTIGGHILFPRSIKNTNDGIRTKLSINKVRAEAFFDRIDLFLIDLKKWYTLNSNCKMKDELDKNSDWLDCFMDFESFIDFFYLNDFVDETYNVKKLAPMYPDDYLMFMRSNTELIMKRNKRILNAINVIG